MKPEIHTNERLPGYPGLRFDAHLNNGRVRSLHIWLKDVGGDLVPIGLGEKPEEHWLGRLVLEEMESKVPSSEPSLEERVEALEARVEQIDNTKSGWDEATESLASMIADGFGEEPSTVEQFMGKGPEPEPEPEKAVSTVPPIFLPEPKGCRHESITVFVTKDFRARKCLDCGSYGIARDGCDTWSDWV